jgi:hypothetical protein
MSEKSGKMPKMQVSQQDIALVCIKTEYVKSEGIQMCHSVGMRLSQPMRNHMRKSVGNQVFMYVGAHLSQLLVISLF